MTKRDFILSILTSLIATILFELGRKLYPRFRQLSIRVIALRIPLKKAILTNYHLLRISGSRFVQVTIEILADGFLKLYTGIFKNDGYFQATLGILFGIAFIGILSVTPKSPRASENLESPVDKVVADYSSKAMTYPGELQVWAKSANSVVVKVPTRERGKSVYISIPKNFPQDDLSSLNYLVNTNDGRCKAYVRSKTNEEIATTECSVLWYTYRSSL